MSIYLDYNATAPIRPEAKEAMLAAMDLPLNPSSIHAAGRAARKQVETARKDILTSINGERLVFCGSATEANNLALAQTDKILVSAIEHESVYKCPHKIAEVKVTKDGVVDLEDLEKSITQHRPSMVSVMLANNETGVIQPIAEIARIARKYNSLTHCDAVQGFGKIDIDFKALDVDFMTISSHKVGGPVGSAALIHKPHFELKPINYGGGQEKNKRPGTEDVPAIIGFGKIAQLLGENISRETTITIKNLRDYLEDNLTSIAQGIVIYGKIPERLPNTSSIALPGMESATQLIHFDSKNICVSAGSACSSGKVEVSRVLKAMDETYAKYAIRVSLGWKTTKEEVDAFIREWEVLYNRSKDKAA